MYEFLMLALAAALGVAVVAGPVGCLVVWQRMAYFGDTLAHGALLGIALSLWTGLAGPAAVLLTCLLIAGGLLVFERQGVLALDTVLGILSHSFLALGLVAIALVPGGRIDMEALLFGDILTVSREEVAVIWVMSVAVLLVLARWWPQFLSIIVHRDLATVEGLPVERLNAASKLLLALVVAVAMKIVGVLLITALLIIPAASARRHARTPEQMAGLATLMAVLAVLLGFSGAWWFDLPVGPAMVLGAALIFLMSNLRMWPRAGGA